MNLLFARLVESDDDAVVEVELRRDDALRIAEEPGLEAGAVEVDLHRMPPQGLQRFGAAHAEFERPLGRRHDGAARRRCRDAADRIRKGDTEHEGREDGGRERHSGLLHSTTPSLGDTTDRFLTEGLD